MFFDGLLAPLQKCVNGLFTFQDDEVGKLPLKGGIALSTEVFGSTKTACRIDTTTIMKIGTTIFSDECSFLPTGGILISRKNNIWRAKSKRTQNSGCSITFWIYQNSTTGYDENSRNKEYVSHNATGSIQRRLTETAASFFNIFDIFSPNGRSLNDAKCLTPTNWRLHVSLPNFS